MVDNILDRLSSLVNSNISTGHRKIAQAILTDPKLSARENQAELAKRAGVSEPTISRFCKEVVGAANFHDFKLTLISTMENEPVSPAKSVKKGDSVNDITRKIIDSIIASLKEAQRNTDTSILARAIDLVSQSRRIIVCAQGTTLPCARSFYAGLLSSGVLVECYDDPVLMYKAVSTLHAGELCMVLSNTGENRDVVQAARLSMDNAVSCLTLCPQNTTLADLSHLNLACGYKDQQGSQLQLGNFIMQALLQIIIAGVTLRRADMLMPFKERLEHATDTLYLNRSSSVLEQDNQQPKTEELCPDKPITTLEWKF